MIKIVRAVFIFSLLFVPNILLSQAVLRTWTGVVDNDFLETGNWNPQGLPDLDDTLIIPQTNRDPVLSDPATAYSINLNDTLRVISFGIPNTISDFRVQSGGRLEISSSGGMSIGGKWRIENGGVVRISSAINITSISDDVVLNGALTIDSGITTKICCNGDWTRGSGSVFSPGTSTFYFTNSGRQLNVDRGTFHTLVLGPVLSILRIAGNVNVGGALILRDSVIISQGDTLTVSNRSNVALIDSFGGRILRGAVRRAIDTTTGRIRFHDSNIAIEFLNTTGIPNFITLNAQPETTFLPTPLIYVRRFYDIGREGGGGFQARLMVRYDPTEIQPTTIEDSLRLWRTTNEGQTWSYVPSTVYPDSNFIVADSVTEFSKWGFGIPNSPPTRVRQITFVPEKMNLEQNYPNPFNPATLIRYSLSKRSYVTLKVFSILGQEILSLVNTEQLPGVYEIEWTASGYPSGVYFYRLQAGTFVQTRKMTLVK